MKIEFVVFIVLSAFLHAFYNFLMRRSGGSRVFVAGIFIVGAIVGAATALGTGALDGIPWKYVPFVYSAAFFYTLYQVFVSRAYENGDISKYYPLTVLSPALIPLWAFLFLGEHISFLTLCGIFISIFGALIVEFSRVSFSDFKKMFKLDKSNRSVRYAFAASFVYSIGAVLDKSGIVYFKLAAYMAILLISMVLNLVFYFTFIKKEPMVPYFMKYWKAVVLGGIVVFFSFLTFRVALKLVPVHIAVPIRQVAIVFAILFGVIFLKEKLRPSNWIGSLLIIIGVVLVSISK